MCFSLICDQQILHTAPYSACRWFIVRTVGRLLMLNPSHFMTAKMPFFLPMWIEAKRQSEPRMINDDYRERWVADGLVCGWQTKTGAIMPTTLGRSCQGRTSLWGCQSKVSCKHMTRPAPTRNLALNENESVLASPQNRAQLRELCFFLWHEISANEWLFIKGAMSNIVYPWTFRKNFV